MKGKWDDFIDEMAKDVQPAKTDPKEINMNELGKMMEEQVKKAFESVSTKQEQSVPEETTPENTGDDVPEETNNENESED